MADDYSWIKPATGSIANMLGLNPEAAAKGRALQSQQEYNAARTENAKADTALSPYRQKVYEAQAGKYGADTGKTQEETKGLGISNNARTIIANALASGAASYGEDGSLVISPGAVNTVGSALAAMDANPDVTMKALRGLGAMAGKNARVRAQAGGISAAFRPDAAFSDQQGQEIMGAKEDAALERTTTGANIRGQYSVKAAEASKIASALAKGQPGPSSRDLLNQAEAVKIGSEYAKTVPQNGLELNEVQALQLSRAAQAANPNLNPQDAIDKFVRDNPGMIKDGGWFSSNTFNIPPTDRAAPAARATSNYGTRADGTQKGAGFLGEITLPNKQVATEVSVGVNINGKETQIPALVPTLSSEQRAFIANGGDPRTRPDIIRTATEHASQRIASGMSPFNEPAPRANDSWKGAPSMSMQSVRPAATRADTKEQYDMLPVGTVYVAPDGSVRTKK